MHAKWKAPSGSVGQSKSDAVKRRIRTVLQRCRSALGPHEVMLTMDYAPDRVTVWLDPSGKITKIRSRLAARRASPIICNSASTRVGWSEATRRARSAIAKRFCPQPRPPFSIQSNSRGAALGHEA